MCGISGLIDQTSKLSSFEFKQILEKMNALLSHRGPDGEGCWLASHSNVGLAHRRLAILDLSNQAHQPMLDQRQRYVLSFNGEIYNYLALKNKLAVQFKSHSDTEVLVEAISAWGVEATLNAIEGMFALAVYDIQEQKIYLARDRMGEKPLYFYQNSQWFGFASELSSFKVLPNARRSLNFSALHEYFSYNYIPAPHSIYNEVSKLKPGHYLVYSCQQKKILALQPYFKLGNESDHKAEAAVELEPILKATIARQMVADRPVGAFLSGGIDSSVVVALMSEVAPQKIATFTIGFNDSDYDESRWAEKTAQHFNTQHTTLRVNESHLLDLIPKMAQVYSEPFADSSQIVTLLLCQQTRNSLVVSLSGDGGDELFYGYNRYQWGPRVFKTISFIPEILRQPLAQLLGQPFLAKILQPLGRHKFSLLGDKLAKIARVLASKNEFELYQMLLKNRDFPNLLTSSLPADQTGVSSSYQSYFTTNGDFAANMRFTDLQTYLPDDILTKVDRAAMACGLEVRVPFLDWPVLKWALAQPQAELMNKKPLRKILERRLNAEWFNRPKTGFSVPLDRWLRQELKSWAVDLIQTSRSRHGSWLNFNLISNLFEQHQSQQANHGYSLWNILVLCQWLNENQYDQ